MDVNEAITEHFKAFDRMMSELYAYFGTNYKSERVASVYKYLKPCRIPAHDFKRLTEVAQNKFESMNGNLGARLRDIYYQDVREGGNNQNIVYDRIEDHRFPLQYLHQGLNILRTKGQDEFARFAENVRMPQNDRARVIHTCKVRYPDVAKSLQASRSGEPTHIGDTQLFKLAERSPL